MKKVQEFIKSNYKKIIIILAIIIVVFLFVFLSNRAKEKIKTFTVEDQKLYQYLDDNRVDYDGKITFSNVDGITNLKLENVTTEEVLDSTPFYYDDMDMVLLPQNMSVVFPRDNAKQELLPYYSIIDMQSTNYVELKNGTNVYDLQNGFIYDGNDLYIFVTETILKYENKIVKLKPLSFVKFNNLMNSLNYYNYGDSGAVVIQNIEGDVFAETDGYTLNLKVDGIKKDDDYRLLIKKIEILNKLF